MTASAISRPGERERLSSKFAEIDWVLVCLISLIGGAGALMLYSIAGSSWEPWAAKHLVRFGLCVAIMIVLAVVDLRVWFFIAYPLYGLAFVMLVGVDVLGHTALGAQRWLDIGPIRIQPSELMKIGLVLALARYYHGITAAEAKWSWKLIVPVLLILAPGYLVYEEPDLGTCLLLLMTGAVVMFLAGLSFKVVGGLLATGIAGAVPVILFLLEPYQRARIFTFLNPEADPSGKGYQIVQSKIALGSGGVLGRGYGLGSQSRLDFLPEKQTDFIFATLAEEFGFVGCISMLLLFALVIFICLRIATISHSHFGRISASGVTATFAFYVMINGAMSMGLAPVVGIPMPLLSYGGTVMLTVMIGFGLVQAIRVHRYSEVTSGKGTLL